MNLANMKNYSVACIATILCNYNVKVNGWKSRSN